MYQGCLHRRLGPLRPTTPQPIFPGCPNDVHPSLIFRTWPIAPASQPYVAPSETMLMLAHFASLPSARLAGLIPRRMTTKVAAPLTYRETSRCPRGIVVVCAESRPSRVMQTPSFTTHNFPQGAIQIKAIGHLRKQAPWSMAHARSFAGRRMRRWYAMSLLIPRQMMLPD